MAPSIGWPLLPVPDTSGRLRWPTVAQNIQESIRVILQTSPGEQMMRPGFGAGLQNFIGRPDSVATRRQIKEQVQGALETWERRILIEAVDVLDAPSQPGRVRIEIRFRLRSSGAPDRLSLTLALEMV